MLLLTLITCHYADALSSIHKNRVVYCRSLYEGKKINGMTVYMESDVHERKEFKGFIFCLYRICTNDVLLSNMPINRTAYVLLNFLNKFFNVCVCVCVPYVE